MKKILVALSVALNVVLIGFFAWTEFGRSEPPPTFDFFAQFSERMTSQWDSFPVEPGQVVLLIVLCPAMVGVVTEAPDGHLFDPRDVNDTVEPGEVATP